MEHLGIFIAECVIALLEFMGVTPGGLFIAVVILLMQIFLMTFSIKRLKAHKALIDKQDDKLDKIWDLLRAVENEQSGQNRRITDHADFFDVIRADVDKTLAIATASNELSTKAVNMMASHLTK